MSAVSRQPYEPETGDRWGWVSVKVSFALDVNIRTLSESSVSPSVRPVKLLFRPGSGVISGAMQFDRSNNGVSLEAITQPGTSSFLGINLLTDRSSTFDHPSPVSSPLESRPLKSRAREFTISTQAIYTIIAYHNPSSTTPYHRTFTFCCENQPSLKAPPSPVLSYSMPLCFVFCNLSSGTLLSS